MSEVRWIKISTNMFDDDKIRLIETLPDGDSILVIWVKLLVLAGRVNQRGEIFVNDEVPFTEEMLATIFHRKINTVRLALQTFSKFRMIEIQHDQTILITNWNKHQSVEGLEKIRQMNLERVRRHRLKERIGDCNVTRNVTMRDGVTLALRNGSPQNKNESKETDKPPTVPQGGQRNASEEISDAETAKRLICETILNGKNPARPWSDRAQQRLAELLPIPKSEIDDIAWFRSIPKSDDVPELKARRDPITETTLMDFWGDEVQRAKEYRRKYYSRERWDIEEHLSQQQSTAERRG